MLTLSTTANPNRPHTCQNPLENMKRKHFVAFSYYSILLTKSPRFDRDISIDGNLPMGATGLTDANKL